jgi:hypothetical protein
VHIIRKVLQYQNRKPCSHRSKSGDREGSSKSRKKKKKRSRRTSEEDSSDDPKPIISGFSGDDSRDFGDAGGYTAL